MSCVISHSIKEAQLFYHNYLVEKYMGVYSSKFREPNMTRYVTVHFGSTAKMFCFLNEFEEYKQANAFESIAYMLKALINK